ncbi:cysteine desulfurase family protein [Macrococcus armenti]|uniref:cysteine desulfurase family protein n=1 Tax=Macrococcus armenti TaxID=2875764 RepID=UPI001CCFC855|nr:cysteine desulfurase family protein [Macrococcus armenti]UBH14677.1 cysteine desulfurase [Macrococcus armenti]UBH17036.1 cysteine desulfurase [Macrococcus armenti]UBH19302.1 cysteine desulfurase [Macrococcus armenti]
MIYLDNCATTKPDADVMKTFNTVNEKYYFNPSSPHYKGLETNKLLEQARNQIKEILKLGHQSVVFTSGATESNNLLITGMARSKKPFGKTIITSHLEHPSVLETVRALENEGFTVKYVQFNEGKLDLEHFRSLLNSDVTLVCLMHVNNVMGAILPITAIHEILKDYPKVHFHVDCVQSFGKLALPVHAMDSFVLSGHKFNGLKGQGILVFDQLKTITHTMFGGGQEYGFRSGTVNVANDVALSRAIRIAENERVQLVKHTSKFKMMIEEAVKKLPGLVVNSLPDGAPHIVNIGFPGVKGEVIVNAFSKADICISTTSACSSKRAKFNEALNALHVPETVIAGSVRISFDKYTTEDDINQFINVLNKIYNDMKELIKDAV